MLDNGAQFLSNDDLEQIEQTFEMNMETSGVSETLPSETEPDENVSEEVTSTRLNFE